MKCYYLDYSQQPKGPYPDLWIDQLIHSGMLDDNIQVWCEQIGEWMTWEDYVKKSQDYIECPHCGSQLKIEQEFFEKKLQCPYCNEKFICHAASAQLLWNLFEKIKQEEISTIPQWLSERDKFHSQSSSNTDIGSMGILTSGFISALKTERDNQRLRQLNHFVSCQIFLLCCLVLSKQIKRTSLLEFREYCILSGLHAAAFDKILSCELSKAFIVVNHNHSDCNEIYYFKNIAEYCKNNIDLKESSYFAPACNSLIPWYYASFLKNIATENYLTLLGELRDLVVLPEFKLFSCILKDTEIQGRLEKIIITKIAADDFTKKEFEKIKECLSPLPFGMEWLFKSASVQQSVCDHCIKKIDQLLHGEEAIFPDFAYDMLSDVSETNNRIAKKLFSVMIARKMNFEDVKHIFDVLECFGFGMNFDDNLFTLKRICPFFLSEDSSAVFSIRVLLVQKADLSCPGCQGNGKVLCPKCNGTKKVNCPECGGEGTVYSYKTDRDIYCPKCHGRKKITCDNNCQGDRSISGELKYYVKCKQCNGNKTVSGMRTKGKGTFCFNRSGCFVHDEDSIDIEVKLPFKPISPLKHMDSQLAEFCNNEDCFFFADKSGLIFCCKKNPARGINPEYMIEVVSRFYTYQLSTRSQKEKSDKETVESGSNNSQKRNENELTNNEKLYLKCYLVANKDGVIDASERRMLEYQAFNILKLTPQRVEALEALAQFLDEGEIL